MKNLLIAILAALCCTTTSAQKFVGADISLLPTYEEQNVAFMDSAGNKVDVLNFLKQEGWNAIRLRVFVNPEYASQQAKDEGVFQSLQYTTKLAKRVKELGMKLMIDFHYSDKWADPGQQSIPRHWAQLGAQQLIDTMYSYTKDCLLYLKQNGAEPDLIQVGNEITYGMLWPMGKVTLDGNTGKEQWALLTSMIKSGSRACREICPEAKIIIHIERAGEPEKCQLFYDMMNEFHVDYDIIGLSYYPMWHKNLQNLDNTLSMLENRYPDKDIMIVETAYFYTEHKTWPGDEDTSKDYPYTPQGQKKYTLSLIDVLKKHDKVNGLFWWCAEENCYNNNVLKTRMNRGLWNNDTGRALPALYSLREFNS